MCGPRFRLVISRKSFACSKACVVHQHVQPAEQPCGVLDGSFGVLNQVDRERVPTAGLGDGRAAGLVDIGHSHLGSALSGAERDRTPEPACTACYQKLQQFGPIPSKCQFRNAIGEGVCQCGLP